MEDVCDLCVRPSKNQILLNENYKNLIALLLPWFKYKLNIQLYKRICEDCYAELTKLHRFLDVIQEGLSEYMITKPNNGTAESHLETFPNISETSLNKRRRIIPKRFKDYDSILVPKKPIKIVTDNNANIPKHEQLIAKLCIQNQSEIILADVIETNTNNSNVCNFICKFCQKIYDKELCLKQHVVQHLQENEKENLQFLKYICIKCGKIFNKQYPVRRHFKNSHNLEKLHKCHQCSALFKYKYNLQYHIARHNNEKPFKCEVCDKSFILNYELLLHARIHTGEKPHKCSNCGHSFAHRSNLVKHHRLCLKPVESNNASATHTDSNLENAEINLSVINTECNETGHQIPSIKNSINATNNNYLQTSKFQTCNQIYMSTQEQAKKRAPLQTKRIYSSNPESLLKLNITKECNTIQTSDEKQIENNLSSHQGDVLPAVNTTETKHNNTCTLNEGNTGKFSPDLRVARKPFLSQNKDLDQKVVITKIDILPPLNITTKATLPIQNLIQMPSNYKYQCIKCWKHFKRSYALKKHLKTHTDEKLHQCRDIYSTILSDSSNYKSYRKRKASHKKLAQASPLSKSPLNITCSSPTYSIVSDPDPDGREIIQMIKARENESDCNSSGIDDDDTSLSTSSFENTMWEEALDKVLFQPEIMQNIRNNINFSLKSVDEF